MTDRLLEFRSACRLARRRLGVGPPTPTPLPALPTSLLEAIVVDDGSSSRAALEALDELARRVAPALELVGL